MNKIFFLLVIINLISCGKDSPLTPGRSETIYKVEPAQAEDYSYEFTKRDCTTGVQAFQTLIQACDGLRNNDLNNECAKEKREELFVNSKCSGDFT
jgi:hypothetical protein